MISIRSYSPSDAAALAALFHDTIHSVNAADYSPEQLDAWAPAGWPDIPEWNARLSTQETLVAEIGGEPAGFGSMDADGCLDLLYVGSRFQHQGVAGAICDRLESGVDGDIITHASITALPFFRSRGYRLLERREVVRRGVTLVNYTMILERH